MDPIFLLRLFVKAGAAYQESCQVDRKIHQLLAQAPASERKRRREHLQANRGYVLKLVRADEKAEAAAYRAAHRGLCETLLYCLFWLGCLLMLVGFIQSVLEPLH